MKDQGICPIKPNAPLNKKIVDLERKMLKGIPNSDLHGSFNFKKLGQIIKNMPPGLHFQPNPHFFQWTKRYIGKDCLNIDLV